VRADELSFERVGPADLAPGTVVGVEVGGVSLAVVRCADGTYHAVYNECSHEEIPLSEGEVDGCTLECWLHGSRFDVRTGEPTGPPAAEPVPVYPVEVRDGDIYVSLTASNGVNP
jgi:3-phenylpropionate/trans-cinnamate dioxygenase ferredoxin subunit